MFCPVCKHPDFSNKLTVKDYTVSGEPFDLVECTACGFRFTQNPPSQDQIGRYYQSETYISHTDSKKGIFNIIYQLIRKQAVKSKRSLVCHFSQRKTGKLLDYGCGTGAFLLEMKSAAWEVQGMEPDPGARSRAEALTASNIMEPEKLAALDSASVDVVTMWHVLEHVHDLHETLSQVKRILNENGLLVVAVPNHMSHDASHYAENWAAYDVPRHLYHFSPASITHLMKMHGLEVREVLPMWYDAFYVSLLSEKYKTGSMRLMPAVWTGMMSNLKALFNKGVCSSQIYIITQ